MSTPEWAKGMERLGPGCYASAGTLHIDAGELLQSAGWADTPENRATLEAAMRQYAGDEGIEFSSLEG